jgi:hypothetical protein
LQRWQGAALNFRVVLRWAAASGLSLEAEHAPSSSLLAGGSSSGVDGELGCRLGAALRFVGEKTVHPAARNVDDVERWLQQFDGSLMQPSSQSASSSVPSAARVDGASAAAVVLLPQFRSLEDALPSELVERQKAHLHDLLTQATELKARAMAEAETIANDPARTKAQKDAAEGFVSQLLEGMDELYEAARQASEREVRVVRDKLGRESRSMVASSWVAQPLATAFAGATTTGAATSSEDAGAATVSAGSSEDALVSGSAAALAASDPRVVQEDETLLHLLQARVSAAHEHLALVHADESATFHAALQALQHKCLDSSVASGDKASEPLAVPAPHPYHAHLAASLARDSGDLQRALVASLERDSAELDESVSAQIVALRAEYSKDAGEAAAIQRAAEEAVKLPLVRFRALVASQSQRVCSVVLRLIADFRKEMTAHEQPALLLAALPSTVAADKTKAKSGKQKEAAVESPEVAVCPVRLEGAIEDCALTFLPRMYCQRLEGFTSDARQLASDSLAEARTEVTEALAALRAARVGLLEGMTPQELAESDHAARKIQASFRLHRARRGGSGGEGDQQEHTPRAPNRGRPPRSGNNVRPNHAAAAAPTTMAKLFAGCSLLAPQAVAQFSQADANALLAVCQPSEAAQAANENAASATGNDADNADAQALHVCVQYLRQMRVLDLATHGSVSDLAASLARLRAQDASIEAALQRYVARSGLLPGTDTTLSAAGMVRLRTLAHQMAIAFRLVRRAEIEQRLRQQQQQLSEQPKEGEEAAPAAPAPTSEAPSSVFDSEEALLSAVEQLREESLRQLSDALNPLYHRGDAGTSNDPSAESSQQQIQPVTPAAPRVIEGLWMAGGGCSRCLISFYMPAVASDHRAQQKKIQSLRTKDCKLRAHLSVLELSVRCAAFRAGLMRSSRTISSALRRLHLLPAPADPERFMLSHPLELEQGQGLQAWQCCDLPDAECHAHSPLADEPLANVVSKNKTSEDDGDDTEPLSFASAPTLDALVRFDVKLHRTSAGRTLGVASIIQLLERFHELEAKRRTLGKEDEPVFPDEAQLLLAVHHTLRSARSGKQAAVLLSAPASPAAPVVPPGGTALNPTLSNPSSPAATPSRPRRGILDAFRRSGEKVSAGGVVVGPQFEEEIKRKQALVAAELAAADAALEAAEKKRAAAEARKAAALAAREADLSKLSVRQRVAAEREAAALKIQSLERGRAARQAASVRRAMRDRLRLEAEAEAEAQRKLERRRIKRRTLKNSQDEQLAQQQHDDESSLEGAIAVASMSSAHGSDARRHEHAARPVLERQVSTETLAVEEVVDMVDAAVAVAPAAVVSAAAVGVGSPSLSAAAATHSSSLQGRTGGTASLATTPEVRWVVQISDADEGEAGGSNLLASSPLTTPPTTASTAAATAAAAAVLSREAGDEEEEPLVEVVEDSNEP